ncbi:MAG: hypothetical protein QXW82_07240 [Candidatus Bathyarchaeia archaeon]
MESLSSEEIKNFAKEQGADLVGIASIDRFEGAPPHLHPAKTLLPTAKSIVVVAKRIPRGCYRGNLEGTNFTSYAYCGYFFQQHRYYMIRLDYEVARFIERHGFEAVPTQGAGLHFRIAAFAAGLGQIGWHKLLITPQFGPRVRFGIIATEAELEPDPIYDGKLCDPEDCGYRCVYECPNGAVPKTRKITINVAGRTVEFSDLDLSRCVPDCIRQTKHSPFILKEAERSPAILEQVEALHRQLAAMRQTPEAQPPQRPPAGPPPPTPRESIDQIVDCYRMMRRHTGFPAFVFRGATGCMEACIEYLEEKGKVPRYKYPFRRRAPWKL